MSMIKLTHPKTIWFVSSPSASVSSMQGFPRWPRTLGLLHKPPLRTGTDRSAARRCVSETLLTGSVM